MSPANRVLAALPAGESARLRPPMAAVPLRTGEVLYRPGGPADFAYFPTSGVISVVVVMADGASAEAGMVGREGFLGLCLIAGARTSPFEAVVQSPGEALRVPAELFEREWLASPGASAALRRYADAFVTMVSQSAACNRLHPAGRRLARWLLMTHDRAGGDEFPLTHEFLGRVLGVRRMSLTPPARKLSAAGLIRYRRGRVAVLDRPGLEAASCECYAAVRARLDALLPPGS